MAVDFPPPSVQSLAQTIKRMLPSPLPDSVTMKLAKKLQKNWNGQISSEAVLELPQKRTPVINATGIVLHTNLGRAPLGATVIERIRQCLSGYTDLEINLSTGERGSRTSYLDSLFEILNPNYSPFWVNNNAAAVMLALSTLKNQTGLSKMIISRGELVEIGGGFRVPEIMKSAGFELIEIGTTNKTALKDYRDALKLNDAVVCVVHPSNFKIMGFTESVDLKELSSLCEKFKAPLLYDVGTLTADEIRKLPKGFDCITLSTDKTLGATQGGLMICKAKLQKQCLKNPLYRALRLSKLSLVALETAFEAHVDKLDRKVLPVSTMLNTEIDELGLRADEFLKTKFKNFNLRKCSTLASVGGGSWPGETWPSVGLQIVPVRKMGANDIVNSLRKLKPVVLASVQNNLAELNLASIMRADLENLNLALQALDLKLQS